MFSNKRGLRKLRSFKNKADSKSFNSQSDEGRELAQTQIFQPRQAQRTRTSVKTHRRYSKISKINSRNKAKKWHFSKSCIIPALLLLASFASLIYPHAAMWLSQYHMSEVAAEYARLITHAVPAPHEQLARAREYNQKLSSGAIYEANTNIPTSHGETSDASQDYWEQLKANDDGLMARLRIKKIDLDLPVYHGTEDVTLLKGLGHLRGTSLPVGGKGTRSVITGHRGLASAEMFTRLDEIVKGDTFTIEVFDEILTYKVVDKIVVNPDETKKIAAVPGKDLVTLITCTPLGINTQRILVTGERVVPTPAADKALRGKKPDVPRFPWWVLGCFGSLCVVGGYVWWAGLPVKKKKKEDEEDSEKDSESSSAASSEEDRELSSAVTSAKDSAKDSAVRREDLAREEARAIANRPKKRPKVKKSSSRKKRKRGSHGEKTFDWLINILGL